MIIPVMTVMENNENNSDDGDNKEGDDRNYGTNMVMVIMIA